MTPLLAQGLHALWILRGWKHALARFHLLSSDLTSLPYFVYAKQESGSDGPVLLHLQTTLLTLRIYQNYYNFYPTEINFKCFIEVFIFYYIFLICQFCIVVFYKLVNTSSLTLDHSKQYLNLHTCKSAAETPIATAKYFLICRRISVLWWRSMNFKRQ